MNTNSKTLFTQAKKLIPGGVNSPVRAFKSVNIVPPFISHAKGSKIFDVDANSYIDYVGSWGPMILGHAPDNVIKAINNIASLGTSFGASTALELELAQQVVSIFPSIDMIRMVNSGTEATMSAVRLARAFTKKDKIIKFIGCYHGHGDSFLIEPGSGAFGHTLSPGVTKAIASDTLNAKFNDIDSVGALIEKHGAYNIACVIIEPVAGNMGCIGPKDGFLEGLRSLCDNNNILLIFDEVMSGFRLSLKGAQGIYNVRPDLTCLGKIIGGGLPVGAYGGRRDIMELVAPSGEVYQAGTLSGNPLAMSAGLETIKTLKQNASTIYDKLESLSSMLDSGISDNLAKLDLSLSSNRIGSMFSLFFTDEDVYDSDTAKLSDLRKFNLYFQKMLEQGIYIAPSQFEAGFMSKAHTEEDIEKTIKANYKALKAAYDR